MDFLEIVKEQWYIFFGIGLFLVILFVVTEISRRKEIKRGREK
jgi:hypothetical protein